MLCNTCGIEMRLVGKKPDPETGQGAQPATETRPEREGDQLVVYHVAKVACQNKLCPDCGREREIKTEMWRGGAGILE